MIGDYVHPKERKLKKRANFHVFFWIGSKMVIEPSFAATAMQAESEIRQEFINKNPCQSFQACRIIETNPTSRL